MATGQAVRELAAATFAQPLEPPWMAPASLAQARELLAQAKKEIRPEFLRQLLALLVQTRAESFRLAPTRTTTSPVARALLVQAMNAFRTAWEELAAALSPTEKAQAPYELLRLFLAAHADPALPWGEVRLAGNELVAVPAAAWPWGERCVLTGRWFQEDGAGSVRWRSLEALGEVLSQEAWECWTGVQAGFTALAQRDGAAARALAAGFPALQAGFCREEASNTFASLGLAAFPSLPVVLHNALLRFAHRPAFGSVARGQWLTYGELRQQALLLAHGLRQAGLEAGEVLGIAFCEPGWNSYLVDFAALWAGGVSLGIPPQMPATRAVELLRGQGVRMVVGDAPGLARLAGFPGKLLALEEAAGFPPLPVPATLPADPLPTGVSPELPILWDDAPSWTQARRRGIPEDGDKLYTLVVTSGSTGPPKAVPLSRARFRRTVAEPTWLWPLVVASFQPYALLADRARVWNTLLSGGRVGFCRRGAELWRELEQLAPTYLEGPPALFQPLLAPYRAKLREGASPGELAALRLRLRQRLGGRVAAVALGGALVEPELPRLLAEVLQVPVKEGYGATEVGRIAENGYLRPEVEVRLVDRPELGFTRADRPHPRGELAVKLSPEEQARVREAQPERVTEDGFFLTGDLVELQEAGKVRVLGRAGNLLKLPEGTFFAPEAAEGVLYESGLVRHGVLLPNPRGGGVVAVVVPATRQAAAGELAARLGTLLRQAGVPLAGIVVDQEGTAWSPENGLLTPSFKPNRQALAAFYAPAIEKALQAGLPPEQTEGAVAPEELLERILGPRAAGLDPTRPMGEQGLDSLAAAELLAWADAQGVKLEPGELAALAPGQLLAALGRRGKARQAAAAGGATPAADTDPAFLLLSTPLPKEVPPFAPEGWVLLSGATGFVGIHLLAELLANPAFPRVVALVRARSHAHAGERLAEKARRCQLVIPEPAPPGAEEARLWAVAADLGSPSLGLPEELYRRLAQESVAILHAAAAVRHGASLAELVPDNVEPTRQLLRLATTGRLKAFHLVSTLDVTRMAQRAGMDREEAPLPPTPPGEVRDGYVLSKWVAERMVELASRHCGGAMPVLVSRPGLVSWASTTGVGAPNEWFFRLLLSCLALRVLPVLEPAGWPSFPVETETSARGIEPLPVDFLARALVQLTVGLVGAAAAGKPGFYRMNLVNTNPGSAGLVSWPQLFWSLQAAWLAETSEPPLALVSFRDFRDRCLWEGAPFAPLAPLFPELPALPRQKAELFAAFLQGQKPPAFSWELCRPLVRWALQAI